MLFQCLGDQPPLQRVIPGSRSAAFLGGADRAGRVQKVTPGSHLPALRRPKHDCSPRLHDQQSLPVARDNQLGTFAAKGVADQQLLFGQSTIPGAHMPQSFADGFRQVLLHRRQFRRPNHLQSACWGLPSGETAMTEDSTVSSPGLESSPPMARPVSMDTASPPAAPRALRSRPGWQACLANDERPTANPPTAV